MKLKKTIHISLLFSIFLCCKLLAETNNVTKYLLDNAKKNLQQIKNLQCQVEYLEFQNPEGQRKRIQAMKASEDRELRALGDRLEADIALSQNFFEKQKLIFDSNGRSKIEASKGYYDKSGNAVEFKEEEVIDSWDGEKSITYHRYGMRDPNHPAAEITGRNNEHLSIVRTPFRLFGDRFLSDLASALASKETIAIENDANTGTYSIKFNSGNKECRGIIDSNKGYSVISSEIYYNGKLRARFNGEHKKIDSVWIPVGGMYELFVDGMTTQSSTNVIAIELKINDVNFSKDLFNVDLPQGTLVANYISKREYVIGDPNQTKIIGPLGERINLKTAVP